jgi:hypothetical protein
MLQLRDRRAYGENHTAPIAQPDPGVKIALNANPERSEYCKVDESDAYPEGPRSLSKDFPRPANDHSIAFPACSQPNHTSLSAGKSGKL